MGKLRAVIIPATCSVPLPLLPTPYAGGWVTQGDLQRAAAAACPPSTKRQRQQLTPADIARNARIALTRQDNPVFPVGGGTVGIERPAIGATRVIQGVGPQCKINSYQATSTW